MKTPIFDKYEQIKLLIDNSEDIISIHDIKGNYLFYGGSAKYDFLAEKIVGKSPYDFYEEEVAKKIIEQIIDTAKSGKRKKFETKIPRYGKEKWFQINLSPIRKNDKIVSVIKICRDITDIVIIKQKILKQKNFFKNIINSISQPLYVIDVETYKVVLANTSTSSNLSVKTKSCYALTHNSDKPCWENGVKCPVNIIKRTKSPCIIEHIHVDENNEEFITEVHGFPVFDENDNVIQVIEYNVDITEKKKLEQALIVEKEKAEESNRLKSSFLANMSHEIRTPMNAILGFGELLKNDSLSSEKKEEFIDIINSSGAHLLEIIEDIIDISKIDSKQIQLRISKFRLNPFINDIYKFFNSRIENKEEKELRVYSKIENGNDLIISDRKRLKQILINLLSNAIKFTHRGTIELYYSIKEKQLLFSVKDTGVGISEKDIPFVFDRFRQVGKMPEKVFVGTGLGLAISKGFVELMGGHISVVSKEGEGSNFSFSIPLLS